MEYFILLAVIFIIVGTIFKILSSRTNLHKMRDISPNDNERYKDFNIECQICDAEFKGADILLTSMDSIDDIYEETYLKRTKVIQPIDDGPYYLLTCPKCKKINKWGFNNAKQ